MAVFNLWLKFMSDSLSEKIQNSHTQELADLNLKVSQLENELSMTQIFLSRILLKLIETDSVKNSDLKAIFEALEHDFPYPQGSQTPTNANDAMRYLFKTVFSQMPNQQTAQFAKHYK